MAVSNTIDTALVTDMLSDRLITVAQSRLAPLRAFSRDFGTDPMKPRATVQVRKATAGATTQTNATNFSAGNSTLDNVAVTVAQVTQAFGLSNEDLQKGTRLEHIADVNAGALFDKIMDLALAPVTVANSATGAASFVGNYITFTEDDLIQMYVDIKKGATKYAVLDSGYFAKLKYQKKSEFISGTGRFLGFEDIFENTRWTGAGTNVVGLACDPNAVAVCSGLPVQVGGQAEYISQSVVSLPLGISAVYSLYFDPELRQYNAAWDLMFGAAIGDTTVLSVITSA